MYVSRLALADFRSYPTVAVDLPAGVVVFCGRNGQGKTNLLEAVDYIATLTSHRVATDGPLVRAGADRAVVGLDVQRAGRRLVVEVQINPSRSNRARVNGAALPRPRELLGLLRTVLFAPQDQGLVQGDPAGRRRFLDELLVARAPRFAGVRADYERVLKQRNALLKSAGAARRGGDLTTLDVWDGHLAAAGAELLHGRLELVEALRPLVDKAYDAVSPIGGAVSVEYQCSVPLDGAQERADLAAALGAELGRVRAQELDRGVTLAGPHRDDLVLGLGGLPARGYASHGESWSVALALRLGGYDLLRAEGEEPVLLLDDVFAELDTDRRTRLADRVAGAEQVLVTAAVAADVPAALDGARFDVSDGAVTRAAG